MLAVLPTYEEFEDFAEKQGTNKNDEEEVKDELKMFLDDFTEISIKKIMLSQAEYDRNGKEYCSSKDVERFEKQGRKIVIGVSLEEYLNSFDDDCFDNAEEKENYIKEYIVPVKYGIVDYCYS